ncbi:MAG: peptidylprolyl isomerase [Firmicutes bacterium]|nr:peptidylprolyl isomerase [Bacillota bacterium]
MTNKYPIVEITIKPNSEIGEGKKIRLELYPQKAPATVENFLNLVAQGFYTNLIFHRIIDKFMLQGGGMDTSGSQKSAKTIKGEFKSNGHSGNDIAHEAGVISMARTSVKDSASSQFFIMTAKSPHLDGEYAAFGKATDQQSIDNAIALGKVKTDISDKPTTDLVIESILLIE